MPAPEVEAPEVAGEGNGLQSKTGIDSQVESALLEGTEPPASRPCSFRENKNGKRILDEVISRFRHGLGRSLSLAAIDEQVTRKVIHPAENRNPPQAFLAD